MAKKRRLPFANLHNQENRPRKLPKTENGASTSKPNDTTQAPNNAIHGNIFQLKLLMVFLFRAINANYMFELINTEKAQYGKFDDVIFEYEKENQKRLRLVQAKHKKDDTWKITREELFPTKEKGEFSLPMYFKSFQDVITRNTTYGNVEDCVVCTNASFDKISLEEGGIKLEELTDGDDFLTFASLPEKNKTPSRFRFRKESIRDRLMQGTDYTVEVVDRFLDKLVFAVSSPNEQELDDILKNLMGNHLLLSDSELQNALFLQNMLDWFKQKEITSLNQDDSKKILEEIKLRMESIRLTGTSIEYQNHLKSLIGFDQSAITETANTLNELLTIDNAMVKHIDSESPIYTAAKVSVAITKLNHYKTDDSYLLMSHKLLSEGDRINKINKVLGLEGSHILVVIVCEDETSDDVQFCSHLIPEERRNEKKIILIRKKCQNNEDQGTYEDKLVTYEQLDDKTKKNILSKLISFQGVDKSVRDLISGGSGNQNDHGEQEKVLDSNCLIELLFSEQKVVIPSQHFIQTPRFENSKYLERQIGYWVWPTDQQFWRKVAEELKCTVGQLESELKWDASSSRINWIQNDSIKKSEIWKAISKTNSEMGSSTFYSKISENKLIKNGTTQGQVIVISGRAGTGKSFTLSRFYEKLKEIKPNHWVIAFNLVKYCKALWQMDESDDFITFFFEHFATVVSASKSDFIQLLFRHRLMETGNITFLLDGFDEISRELQDKTILFIKALSERTKVDRVFITTRPHMNEKLQDEIHQFVYKLELLEEEDQCKLIVNTWNKIDGALDNKLYVNTFARHLIKQTSQSLNDEDKEFIGVPLQCHILAECFQHSLEEALTANVPVGALSEKCDFNLDLVKLYERLIETKFIIYKRDKIRTNHLNEQLVSNAIQDKTMIYLRELAVKTILETTEDAEVLFNRKTFSQSKYQQRQNNKENADVGVRLGLLDRNEEKVEFLHRTYAEYLVAKYIYQGFQLDEDKHNHLLNSKPFRNLLVEKIFKKDLYEGVMRFFDCMMKSLVEDDKWKRMMDKQRVLPNRFKCLVEVVYLAVKFKPDKEWPILYIANERKFANVFTFIGDCLEAYFNFDLEHLNSVFGEEFQSYITSPICYIACIGYREKVSSTIFRRLLAIYRNIPDHICNGLFNSISREMKGVMTSFGYYNSLTRWNTEERRKVIELALEFLKDSQFKPSTPVKDTYPIMKFFFRNDYYDSILPSLLDYLLIVFEDEDLVELMTLAFRRYACRRYWITGRNETMFKEIVQFVKTKRPNIIRDLLHEILVLGDEELKNESICGYAVFTITANENTVLQRAALQNALNMFNGVFRCSIRDPTPFYKAASCGNTEICCVILSFLKQHRNYNDCKPFLLQTMGDAILFKKIEMYRSVLIAVKKVFGVDNLEDYVQSDMSSLIECYKHKKRKRKENATVFVVTEDEDMFNEMIAIFTEDNSGNLNGRERLGRLFLQHKESLEKLTLLNDMHLRFLVPTDKFDDWLKSIICLNVETGFRVLSKCLNKFDQLQHQEFIRLVTQTEIEGEPSFWLKWFQVNSKDGVECLEKICESISNSLGVETLIDSLLLHDQGYAIILGLFRDYDPLVFRNLLKENQNVWAKKWVEFLPDVIQQVYSEHDSRRKNDYWLDFVIPMLENASKDQLSRFVNVILEKAEPAINTQSIWISYITNKTSGLAFTEQFLKIVSENLGDSELERLIFHDTEYLTDGAIKSRDEAIHVMLSKLKGRHRDKVGDVIIEKGLKHYTSNNDDKTRRFIKFFPFLVDYSDKPHLRDFVDIILTTTFPHDEISVWSECLLCEKDPYSMISNKEKREKLALLLKTVREQLEYDYLEKLILHDDGRIITRVLLWRKQKFVDVILKQLTTEMHEKIAKCLIENTLDEFVGDYINYSGRRFRHINASFFPFLKKHANVEEFTQFLKHSIIQTNKKNTSIWINYLRECVEHNEVDKMDEFWSFLSENVDEEIIKNWLCRHNDDLARIALNGNDKFINLMLNEFPLHDSKDFWSNLIDELLRHLSETKWVTVLPLFIAHADSEQLSKLLEIIMPRNVWLSLWSQYIYHDENATPTMVRDFFNCVRNKFGSSKVKEMVLHSPNEEEMDAVVIRAALNGENDLVETMLRYLNTSDRKEVTQSIERAQNLEKELVSFIGI